MQKRRRKLRAWVLANVRGTVQADILKEIKDKTPASFQPSSASRSWVTWRPTSSPTMYVTFTRYLSAATTIAEAGANPISQLALTLSNGFTFVEAYLARGMHIDDFAPNLSFFFSNGMDPSTPCWPSPPRRIWAVTMREKIWCQ